MGGPTPSPSPTPSAPRERRSDMESLTRSASRLLLPEPRAGGFGAPAAIRPGILGLGTYAPARVLTNQELEQMVETSDEWIVSRTGIRERRIVAPGERTSDLGCHAARRALDDAGVD